MTFAAHSSIIRSLALAGLVHILSACIDNGSGVGGTTPTAQTGVYISGNVRMPRIVLSGPDLAFLGSSSTAYNGGQGGLLSLMLGADGFVYVSNTNAIFKVVPQ